MAFISALLATVAVLPVVTAARGTALSTPATVTIAPNPSYIAAIKGAGTALTATVRDSSGALMGNQAVVWSSDTGLTFSPPTSLTGTSGSTNGVATTTVSNNNGGWGSHTITAKSGTATGTATLYEYGAPARLTLTLTPSLIAANSGSTSHAVLTVTDSNNPPDPYPVSTVTMTRAGGVNVPVTNNGDGTYSATITAATTPLVETITATETAPGGSSLSTTAQLTEFGAANHVDVALSRNSIPATGTQQPAPTPVTLSPPNPPNPNPVQNPYQPDPPRPAATATVSDINGSRVPNETVQFSASGGVTFGAVTNNGDGTYTALITSSTTPDTETITATATRAGVSGSTTLKETFGALHTAAGNSNILDANGNAVMLRGLNLDPQGPVDKYWEHSYFFPRVYDHARDDWGANYLRANLDLDQWMQPCPTTQYDTAFNYRQMVQKYVEAATRRGMYVNLVLGHEPKRLCDTSQWESMPASDEPTHTAAWDATVFWKSIANTFKSNPLVGFELYNEPHTLVDGSVILTDDTWLNGGTMTCSAGHSGCPDAAVPWTAAGMQAMYNAVRSTGATNLVFVDGPGWANGTPPALIGSSASRTHATDPPTTNVVYIVHYYSCQSYDTTKSPPYQCTVPVPQATDTCTTTPTPDWNKPEATLQKWVTWRATNHVPIMENEFGWPNNSNAYDSCFIQSTINFDEANNIPWAAYSWIQWNPQRSDGTRYPDPFSLLAYGDAGDFSPTISGQPVKAALANNQN